MTKEKPDVSIVIRCGRNKDGLLRCLKSVDEPAEIVVSAADDAAFWEEIKNLGYTVAPHKYGNWSLAAEAGVVAAANNHIIMMDADSTFAPGAINIINQTLLDGYLLVQPRVIFLTDKKPLSRVISNARTHENRFQPKAYSPGLGLKRQELLETIGVNGHIYNPDVLYGDDGYLDQTAKKMGIEVYVAEAAHVYHDPVGLKHELVAAFQFGRGEYQLEQDPTSIWEQVAQGFLSQDAYQYFSAACREYGKDTLLFIWLWKLIYVSGFGYESISRQKKFPNRL